MEKENFYGKVGELMGVPHVYNEYDENMRNRWCNRSLGNGRYPGRGCVRMFSDNCIHVMLREPRFNKTFKTPEDALKAIEEVMKG